MDFSTDEIRSLSNRLKAQTDKFKEALDYINTQNANLNSHWEGTDQQSYTTAIARQQKSMNELNETLVNIYQWLVKTVVPALEEANRASQVRN